MSYQIRVIGACRIERDGVELQPERPKDREVFALLCLAAGEWTAAETLEAALWSEAPPKNPRRTLHTSISRARKAFASCDDGPVLEHRSGKYRLELGPAIFDLHEWEAAAVRLADTDRTDLDSRLACFEELRRQWSHEELAENLDNTLIKSARLRYRQRRTNLALDEAATLRKLGRHGDAAELLAERSELDPLREEVVLEALRAFGAASRLPEALALASEYREDLREIGLTPSDDILLEERRLVTAPIPQQVATSTEADVPIASQVVQQLNAIEGLTINDRAELQAELVARFGAAPELLADAIAQIDFNGPDTALVVPSKLSAPVLDRLNALSHECQQVLRSLAVLGPRVGIRTAVLATGEMVEDVGSVIGQLETDGWITPSGRVGEFRFCDRVTSDTILTTVEEARARRWHGVLGRELASAGAEHLAAKHLLAGIPDVDISEFRPLAQPGALAASRQDDHRLAARLLAAAADLTLDPVERAHLEMAEAIACEAAGLHTRAERLYDRILDGPARFDDDLLAAAALGGTGRASRIGGLPRRRRRLDRAMRNLPKGHRARNEVVAELALEVFYASEPVGELWKLVTPVAEDPSADGHTAAARVELVIRHSFLGAQFDSAAHVAQLAEAELQATRYPRAAACAVASVHVAITHGNLAKAKEWLGILDDVQSKSREPRASWQARTTEASIREVEGDSKEADRIALEAYEMGEEGGIADALQTLGSHHLGRAYRSGSIATFHEDIAKAPSRLHASTFLPLVGLSALDNGNFAKARDSFEAALKSFDHRRDLFLPAAAALMIDLGQRLNRNPEVERFRTMLSRRPDRLIVMGYGGPFLGSIEHFVSLGLES